MADTKSDAPPDIGGATEQLNAVSDGARRVRRFQLVGLEGAYSGQTWASTADACAIGSHQGNDLIVEDSAVSRFHCEVRVHGSSVRIKDLDSRNGTHVDGLRVTEAWLKHGSVIRVGRTAIRFQLVSDVNSVPVSDRVSFGSLVGSSVAMRTTFTLLERAAASDATVLLEGETGTGKEGAADSIHRAGARKDSPFLVIDCSALPPNLLESELFGHERGAFTGASGRRKGVFEEAHTGTVFLDEIGELAPDLQPKLLRVLERREVRRVGANIAQAIDVRVIAATNRDLRAEVNAGRFRSDLYFRLAVVRVPLPPLRQRPEDIPELVAAIVRHLGTEAQAAAPALLTPAFMNGLARSAWPGNVRELRNYLQRCLVLQQAMPVSDDGSGSDFEEGDDAADDSGLQFSAARRRAILTFERRFLEKLMDSHRGNVGQAAQASGIHKVYLYRLLHRHGMMKD